MHTYIFCLSARELAYSFSRKRQGGNIFFLVYSLRVYFEVFSLFIQKFTPFSHNSRLSVFVYCGRILEFLFSNCFVALRERERERATERERYSFLSYSDMSCNFSPSPSIPLYFSQKNTIPTTCQREYVNCRISEAIYIRRLLIQ